MLVTLSITAFASAGTPSWPATSIAITLPYAEHGVKLYLAQHGDTCGGRKVELILKDDNPGTSGDVDKRLAQELVVKDKVDILAGFGLTPSAFAVAPVATEAKKQT
mgnify:CR=1 FL=1